MASQNSVHITPLTPQAKLLSLLADNESPILDFKREVHQIDDTNQHIFKHAVDELIRDIIALANGNAVFAGELAFLVLGADDKKNEVGIREIFDVGDHHLSASRILDIVNSACEPKIENIACDEVIIDNKRLLLVTIFPTPYIHETIKRLQPKPDKFFTERTAFIRREQSIGVASQKERETIAQIKRFRFTEKRNPPGVAFGTLLGSFVGGVMSYSIIKNRHKLPDTQEMTIPAGIAGAIFGGTTGLVTAKTYRDFYEIRSYWHKIPSTRRLPGVIISLGVAAIINRALKYILSRIVPKPNW